MTTTFRSLLSALAVSALLSGPALARANPRMAECNKKSAGMKGEERKKFMSECMAGGAAEKTLTPQQQKMKDCNAQAKGMKGKERKAFMKTCLSK